MKYVLVSGGVISGIGKGGRATVQDGDAELDSLFHSKLWLLYFERVAKNMADLVFSIGIIASSSGVLLKATGLKVTAIKVYGGESDLDLGNYTRYLDLDLTKDSNITTGKIYKHVLERERRGDYLGRTVQVVPHITDHIQAEIERVSKIPADSSGEQPDICIIELGGTVGDLESGPFVEALTQFRHKVGKGNFINIHVSYIPIIHGEEKTKPTQHAIRTMRSAGLVPDLIACRCERALDKSTIQKIAQSCQVENQQCLEVRDIETLYQVPLLLEEQGLRERLREGLMLDDLALSPSSVQKGADLWALWKKTVATKPHLEEVSIALVGKYTSSPDSYLSTIKSLEHSAMRCDRKVNIVWIDADNLEDAMLHSDAQKHYNAWSQLTSAAGVLVPGGFGVRSSEGLIKSAKWAREHKVPYLGICLGMQTAVIEAARNLCGLEDATSEEFDPKAKHPVIIFMPEGSKEVMGGTMRLGTKATHFVPGSEWSKLRAIYKNADTMHERHRHRYEVNPDYIDQLEKAGLYFVGKDETGMRMEVVELKDHPFFVGVQAHPEYTSRVLAPSPTYLAFVAAAAGCLEQITKETLAGK
ncbi:hypothetical protein G7046_g6144 [Stylonectria norvegica]|nr:hypothetical protein G7046_g6144 [Stylonectria norvegica]